MSGLWGRDRLGARLLAFLFFAMPVADRRDHSASVLVFAEWPAGERLCGCNHHGVAQALSGGAGSVVLVALLPRVEHSLEMCGCGSGVERGAGSGQWLGELAAVLDAWNEGGRRLDHVAASLQLYRASVREECGVVLPGLRSPVERITRMGQCRRHHRSGTHHPRVRHLLEERGGREERGS